ncbi:MAG TPA: DUF1707 domain-containing protein [Mycobacterium sp.]|nr:DUF1707 domain-containing protein [Mycobacterium sp.]
MATRQTAGTRAKDTDRNDTCQILDSALSEGQLSMAEHGERVKAATTAMTLGDLQALVADLQTNNAPVQLPNLKAPRQAAGAGGGWGMRLAVAGVLVVLGIAIGWGLYGNTPSPLNFTSDPGAKSDGIPATVLTSPHQLLSLGGFNGLFEQMRKKFGDTVGYELEIREDWATVHRADPNDNRRKLGYDYRGGWGDPDSGPEALAEGDRLVDLAKFDFDAIIGVLRGAPETLNVPRADVTTTWLDITPSEDPATPDAVNITIHLSSDFGSGHMTLAPDGTPKEVYPNNR